MIKALKSLISMFYNTSKIRCNCGKSFNSNTEYLCHWHDEIYRADSKSKIHFNLSEE